MDAFHFRPTVAVLLALSALLTLLGPVAIAWWWRRRSGASWKTWGWGVLVFFVSQCVLRLPWQIALGIWLAPRLAKSTALMWAWVGVSSFTAGLFEECGRWAGYRWLVRRERTFRVGVMFGLGHGGVESMLLVGVSLAGVLATYLLLAAHALPPLPPEAETKVVEAMSRMGPGDAIAGMLERVMAVTVQVALSLVVLQSFVRESRRWLAIAIAGHFVVDFGSVAGAMLLRGHGALVVELAVVPAAIAAVLVIRALRSSEGEPAKTTE
jgi:uncharacterized membrane protein YhfC